MQQSWRLKLQLIASVVALLLLVVLVKYINQQGTDIIQLNDRCNLSISNCVLSLSNGVTVTIVASEQTFELEQNNRIALRFGKSSDIDLAPLTMSASLSGMNMDMGTIPLEVNQFDDEFVVNVIPVMCTERNMQWKIDFIVDDTRTQAAQTSVFSATFNTNW
ncbi:hypothetical protein [Catenovulum agarivorans]|nr:hypothetical protein [Catenovulum agarivorans]